MNTDEIVITYYYTPKENQTDSAFYCWDSSWATLVVIRKGDRAFEIGSNGEMRINLPDGDVLRYTSDLLDNGIDTDEKLASLSPDVWENNNWIEFYELNNDYEGDTYATVEEAIEAIKEILNA